MEFSKGVNDYLNHFVTVSDAKAVAILGGDIVLLGKLSEISRCSPIVFVFIIITGVIILSSVIFSVLAIYPRLPQKKKGLIFWENIKQYDSSKDYSLEVLKLKPEDIENEYAKQNWLVSKVLSLKNKNVRLALITFCTGLVFLGITILI